MTAGSQVPAFLYRTSTSRDRVSQRGLLRERSQNEASPLSWMNFLFLVSEEKGAQSTNLSVIPGQQLRMMKCLPCASVVLGEWGNCKEPTMHQQSLWRRTGMEQKEVHEVWVLRVGMGPSDR